MAIKAVQVVLVDDMDREGVLVKHLSHQQALDLECLLQSVGAAIIAMAEDGVDERDFDDEFFGVVDPDEDEEGMIPAPPP